MSESARQERAMRAKALQRRFFTFPNTFVYEDDPHGSADPFMVELARDLLRHRNGHADRPLLLPFRTNDRDAIEWFACAPDGAMARAMASELESFLGPSFAHFAARGRSEDDADRHISPILLEAHWHAIRFSAIATIGNQRILAQWQLYSQLLDRRPRAPAYVPQTFEQLRAGFDRALSARSEHEARAALGAMHERYGLSAENRLFLEIRLAAAFERWDHIARHPLLPTLVHLTLPRETYGDVMEALYRVHVQPVESIGGLDDLLEASRFVANGAARLFRTRGTSQRTSVHKSFVLHELIQENPDAQLAADLLANVADGAFGRLDAEVRARVTGLMRQDSRLEALQALKEERFDRAYQLFWPLEDASDVLAALVLCAREAEDPVKAASVLARLAATSPMLQSRIRTELPYRVSRLVELASRQRPLTKNWSDQLRQADGEADDIFVERWRELARSTDPSDIMHEINVGLAAAQCLLDQAVGRPHVYEQLYPLWHELFVDRCPPDKRLVPVYEALIETLRLRDVFSLSELEMLHQTLAVLILAGLPTKNYGKVVDEVAAIFAQVRSPKTMTWAISVADTLAVSPVGNADARLRLLTAVVGAGIEYASRLSSMQRELLRVLAMEGGLTLPVLPTEAASANDDDDVRKREGLVAFYSLDEAAAHRASAFLTRLYPRVRVECNAEPVCTPRLRKLAQRADIFIFAWKTSKHAAYDCVKAALSHKDALVMAAGGGATSLLSAAVQHIRRVPSA